VREALADKYKNPIKMAEASQQNVVGKKARLHARVLQKQILEITKEDIKVLPLRQAREVATYYMSKVEWWLQMIRQATSLKQLQDQLEAEFEKEKQFQEGWD